MKSCPVRDWLPSVWMTLVHLVKFIPDTIKEWRTLTEILKWETWVPDYEETREMFFREHPPHDREGS